MQTVKLHVANEADLYNPFSPDVDLISDDVKSYLFDRLREQSIKDEVELQIVSPHAIDEERIALAIHDWTESERNGIKVSYRRNMVQQFWMFGIGVAFIALSLMLQSRINVVWFTVLSTIGAFSMWEAASIWIVQNPKLRMKRKLIDKIEKHTSICVRTECH